MDLSRASIEKFIDEAMQGIEIVRSTSKERTSFYNVACAFDIETSSVLLNGEKAGIMYAWVFGINGRTILGRSWTEFLMFYEILCATLKMDPKKLRLPVYIHNAAFDIQWLLTRIEWFDVFAIGTRKVARAVTMQGIEFRCSYILTNKGLAKLSEDCLYYPVHKMVGDLDYTLPRHPLTILTTKEIGYIHHDALVVMSYIQQQIEIEKNVTFIPMTKTGYPRRLMRTVCLKENKEAHVKLMHTLRCTADEYLLLKRCFQGGFTHNCYLTRNKVIK